VKFSCQDLQSVGGLYDCIMFVDVFHHMSPDTYVDILQDCSRLLAPDGYVLIKDISRHKGQVSWLMDRYISGCDEIYMQDPQRLAEVVSGSLDNVRLDQKFRVPFPHYYIQAYSENKAK